MKRLGRKSRTKKSAGKVMTGMLFGSLLGATIGWLTAPTSGEEMRRRIKGEAMGVRERAKTAVGNVESRARDLAAEVSENVVDVNESLTHRQKATTPQN